MENLQPCVQACETVVCLLDKHSTEIQQGVAGLGRLILVLVLFYLLRRN